MPAGWEVRQSTSQNRPYYFNRNTGVTQWEYPEDSDSDSGEEKVRVLHLLVKHAGSRRPASWRQPSITIPLEEAQRQIKAHREAIMAAPDKLAKFKELASQYSDCSSAQNQGDLGSFGRGEMQKPFEETSFSLPVNGISNPIITDSGVHIIYRLA
uniref:Peptidyl-prolyl cis-trans isomerase n=1 Tax=Arcella intermedia TaxID=1963864 RepID=A0A6B2LPC0_9EUKA